MERLTGLDLPSDLAFTLAFNTVLQAQQQGSAIVQMIDQEETPIGLATITDISPDRRVGRPHLYIAPSQRRYSLAAARAGEQFARRVGIRRLMTSINAENQRALSVARRLGYAARPQIMLMKELDRWENTQSHLRWVESGHLGAHWEVGRREKI